MAYIQEKYEVPVCFFTEVTANHCHLFKLAVFILLNFFCHLKATRQGKRLLCKENLFLLLPVKASFDGVLLTPGEGLDQVFGSQWPRSNQFW